MQELGGPVEDSVTKLFYDIGWNGINIEPVKYWFDKLVADRVRYKPYGGNSFMVTADIAENNLIELLKEFDIFETKYPWRSNLLQ